MNINIICDFINDIKSDTNKQLENYFSQNSDILDDIYFIPKKVDKANIVAKLSDMNYVGKVNAIKELYNNLNLKDYISNVVQGFINDTNQSILGQEIYIIIGLDTTTIYSTKHNDKNVTVLLLEATDSLDYLTILLAHEFTHWVRAKYIDHDIFEKCIGERFVTEGIACVYSKERVPNKKDSEYCIVPESTVEWCKNNIEELDKIVKNNLNDNTQMSTFFYMYAKIDIPVRTGYVYGYLKVSDYLKNNQFNVREILTINWQEILK